MLIYAGINGFMDEIAVESIRKLEPLFYKYMDDNYPEIGFEIEAKGEITGALKLKLDEAINAFKKEVAARSVR